MTAASAAPAAPAPAPAAATGPEGWPEFEAAIRRHHRALRGFAARLLRDPDRTDDVVQDAYLRAFRAFPGFDGPQAALEAWLYRIVYRCCVDELRRSRRLARLVGVLGAQPPPRSAELESVERLSLRRALDALTPEVRAAVVLVHWCGLDYVAAGAVLGIPPGTVGSRLTTGRRALRASLEHGGDHEKD